MTHSGLVQGVKLEYLAATGFEAPNGGEYIYYGGDVYYSEG